MLKEKIVSEPVLCQPNFTKTFYLQSDASKYGVGAILSQDGDEEHTTPRRRHPIAFYSATFTPMEQNYDAYELEFLGVLKAIEHWRPYLIWTKEPFIIETDHKNLTYWKTPKKLTGRTARWHEKLQDYNFRIVHIQGKQNKAADALSRPAKEDREQEEKSLALIPPSLFLNIMDADSDPSIESLLPTTQKAHQQWLERQGFRNDHGLWYDNRERLVIPPNDPLKRMILHRHHGGLIGHPGRDETTRKVAEQYYWPGMKAWVDAYVKGCTKCQQNKNLTHQTRVPLYKIPVPENAPLFTQVAMDLITGLPKSQGHNSILTIVNHGCSRATVFLPCSDSITGPQIAQLYYQHVYPWFRLPRRIISDRDPRFTSHFGCTLAKELGISWNLSIAYHPQTDGLSERKNQWVEQFLRLATANQEDWATMLPLATLVYNNAWNATTKLVPNQVLTGLEPAITPDHAKGGGNPLAELRVDQLRERRLLATNALNAAAQTKTPGEGAFVKG